MPGSAAEQRAGHITQLGFDSLAEVSASDGGAVPAGKAAGIALFGNGEVYRSAPQSRRKAKKHTTPSNGIQQFTLDELFARIPGDEPAILTREQRRKTTHNGHITQLGFDSLAELPPEDGSAVQEREPAGNGIGNNGR